MVPTGGLPTCSRSSRGSMPWSIALRIMCISGSRELLDDELVDLGLGAGDDQVHVLVVLARDLPDDARELVEHLPERNHADFEDAALHLREVALEGAMQARELDRELARVGHATANALGQVA